MDVVISPRELSGSVAAVASKSEAHRVLLCAAFAYGVQRLLMHFLSVSVPAEARLGPLYLTANSVAGSAALLFLCAVFMAETAGSSPPGHR